MASSASGYLGSPISWDRAIFRSEVDGFVPQTQHVNLRKVRQVNPSEAEPE